MISASKTTFSHFNLKILRPEVTKNIENFCKTFCEFRPRSVADPLSPFFLGFLIFAVKLACLLHIGKNIDNKNT